MFNPEQYSNGCCITGAGFCLTELWDNITLYKCIQYIQVFRVCLHWCEPKVCVSVLFVSK